MTSAPRAAPSNARAALALAALIAAALLIAAEFTVNSKIVVGSLQAVQRSTLGHDHHSFALALVGALALPMALGARRARPPAAALILLGAVALYVAIAIDYPDTHGHGRLADSASFSDAEAKPGVGFFTEVAGAGLLLLSGGALFAVGPQRVGREERGAEAAARAAARAERRAQG